MFGEARRTKSIFYIFSEVDSKKSSVAAAAAAADISSSKKPLVIKKASCKKCRAPKFQGIDFYLPFCSTDKAGQQETHANLCGAICVQDGKFTKG